MAATVGESQRAPRLSASLRREQLALVAARQFHRLGYHRVSLADVASEAGVTGPAVYRHFRNKEALLSAAITSGLDRVEEAVTSASASTLDELAAAVATVGLERPDMWVLLQRESRFLSEDLRPIVQDQFARVVDTFSRGLRRERPDLCPDEARLLVTAGTAVLSLPSTTHTSVTPAAYRSALIASAIACLRTDLSSVTSGPDVGQPARDQHTSAGPLPRREQVVDTAIGLFFRRGYSGVSLDDIGAAIGIAGPSILHHFTTKSDILVTAFDRASERLADDQTRRRVVRAAPSLADLVRSYIAFCLGNRGLLGVYVSEPMHLPDDALARTRAIVRKELRDWTRALLASSLDLDESLARPRVRAALVAISDLVRLGHFAERPAIAEEIEAIALAVLRSP